MAKKKIAKKATKAAARKTTKTKAAKKTNKAAAKRTARSNSSAATATMRKPETVKLAPVKLTLEELAYQLYLERAERGTPGDCQSDWYAAERIVEASQSVSLESTPDPA